MSYHQITITNILREQVKQQIAVFYGLTLMPEQGTAL